MKKIKIKTGAAGGKRTGPARTFLERVFQTELGNPPDRGRGDLTELSTTCEVPVRIIQIGVIEGVEQFRAELKLMFLVNWEEPEEGQVGVYVSGTNQGVEHDVPISSVRRDC